jgi:hypothetical protein
VISGRGNFFRGAQKEAKNFATNFAFELPDSGNCVCEVSVMPINTVDVNVTVPVLAPPQYFRLPKPGAADAYFGFSRSFYYSGELRGWWKLVRICDEGRSRGVTMVPFADVLKFVREAAGKGAISNPEFDASRGQGAELERERPDALEPER